ncbi:MULTISPECIES: hypothetical protein [unclassified Clostridium]|uniref:hypothetical protein n=1 Tax=unclassified Clostridium TaxID=2614128 RepID=UPI00029819A4|nr:MULTISPECIES: hypothetical protein [unclassified Clostridium]EKQ58096.1 MAG: hypothetical protein A370_00286 [Clostridium sp. Maddingley MBC34-26]
MDTVNNYDKQIGLNYTQNAFNLTGSTEKNKEDQDNMDLRKKNKNIINTKKAYDAFIETSKKYETEAQLPPAHYFIMLKSMMKESGISVPDFKFHGENNENMNFIGFIDKIKNFADYMVKEDKNFSDLPSNFFQFCDDYKKDLIKNACN